MASAVSGKINESVKESKVNKFGTKLVNTVNTSEQVITLQYHSKVSYHLSTSSSGENHWRVYFSTNYKQLAYDKTINFSRLSKVCLRAK